MGEARRRAQRRAEDKYFEPLPYTFGRRGSEQREWTFLLTKALSRDMEAEYQEFVKAHPAMSGMTLTEFIEGLLETTIHGMRVAREAAATKDNLVKPATVQQIGTILGGRA